MCGLASRLLMYLRTPLPMVTNRCFCYIWPMLLPTIINQQIQTHTQRQTVCQETVVRGL